MTSKLDTLQSWVEDVASRTRPDRIHWCDGSDAEYDRMVETMLADGTISPLNQETYPNCYLHLSDPSDVARVEHLTFVCTKDESDAGPNNHWMQPDEAHAKIDALFDGCMQGRTLYVIPYCMGPIDSPYSRCGVEITDSPYVVVNMKLMTRMGAAALQRIEREGTFVKGLHSTGDLDPERRFIMHFPDELTIKSIGSGYGGNALLGKKCHALRIASFQARQEGWLAEHMLIVGLESPAGETHYVACAFPSACGKTNLAMLIPPDSLPGWKVWTLGDDIAWLHLGDDGQLRAINPESGYFGVVPGTNEDTNKKRLRHDYARRDIHERGGDRKRRTLVGRQKRGRTGEGTGRAGTSMQATAKRHIRTLASPSRQVTTRVGRRLPKRPKASRFQRLCSAGAARNSHRSCSKRKAGSTAYWLAPASHPRRHRRISAKSVSYAATRWR